MSLDLDKSTWQTVRFGDVVAASKATVDPAGGSVDRYVAGEHMDSNDLRIHRWGEVGDGYLGPAFHRKFVAGQILYGSRRTYLRKVSVAEFDGVTSNTTFVVEGSDPTRLLQDFLPWVMTSEPFHAYALQESRGSVNPYINFSDLAKFEFTLPPLTEQRRLADLLWAAEHHRRALLGRWHASLELRTSHLQDRMALIARASGTLPLAELITDGRPITYGILMPGSGFEGEGGVPVVKVKDFPNGYIQDPDDLLLTSPNLAHEYRRSTLSPGDLLISIRGTVGRLAEVPEQLGGANITQDSARLAIAAGHSRQYVRMALESEFVQSQIRRNTTGLAVKGLNIGALRKIEIPIPDDRHLEAQMLLEADDMAETVRAAEGELESSSVLNRSLLREVLG